MSEVLLTLSKLAVLTFVLTSMVSMGSSGPVPSSRCCC